MKLTFLVEQTSNTNMLALNDRNLNQQRRYSGGYEDNSIPKNNYNRGSDRNSITPSIRSGEPNRGTGYRYSNGASDGNDQHMHEQQSVNTSRIEKLKNSPTGSPNYHPNSGISVSQVHPENDRNAKYVDLLTVMHEKNPTIGKPYYNYRPNTENGVTKYRAQLIMGAKIKVSGSHHVKADAAEEVAKEMYLEIKSADQSIDAPVKDEPNLKPIPSDTDCSQELLSLSLQLSSSSRKRLNTDELDPVYESDGDGDLPTYDSMLRSWLAENDSPPPTFKYISSPTGIRCTGSVLCPNTRTVVMMTCLRKHHKRGTAREDVCHDLYVLLMANAAQNNRD
ncbi:hypothetical protein BC833DRAFT_439528 [Globomyces pollinis-pini]|nr:hypothetical protein BC833DRAFT_439528 [Globomyces pollinis-pini]